MPLLCPNMSFPDRDCDSILIARKEVKTMDRSTLDSILSGMDRGGWANPAHKDRLPGCGYVSDFDATQLGRSGNELINCRPDLSNCNSHYDIIERTNGGEFLHHRIYKP